MARKISERTITSLAARYAKLFPADAAKTLARFEPDDAVRVIGSIDDSAAVALLHQVEPRTLAAWLAALPSTRLERLGPRLDRAKAAQAVQHAPDRDRERLASTVRPSSNAGPQ